MKFPFPAIAAACIAAAPALAQDAAADTVARLESMTCREFLALDAEGQATVKAAMHAHATGEPLPDTPLPDAAPSGEATQVVEDQTGTDVEADGAGDTAPQTTPGTGAPEMAAGENESGKVSPEGTEASVTDEGGDRRLVAMRTSCEGGPDALALNALRAAFGDGL